jgi:hypothetical protein
MKIVAVKSIALSIVSLESYLTIVTVCCMAPVNWTLSVCRKCRICYKIEVAAFQDRHQGTPAYLAELISDYRPFRPVAFIISVGGVVAVHIWQPFGMAWQRLVNLEWLPYMSVVIYCIILYYNCELNMLYCYCKANFINLHHSLITN